MYSPTQAALEAFDNQHDFERMCADIMHVLGYEDVVLIAPRGGSDGGKDITFRFDKGSNGLACVTLRKDISIKFAEDFHQRKSGDYGKYFLFCTAYVTADQKARFGKYCHDTLNAELVIQDIEALRSLLDVRCADIKARYLNIPIPASTYHTENDLSLYSWLGYIHLGDPSFSLGFGVRDSDDTPYLVMRSQGEEYVGFNKYVPGIKGSINFEYSILSSQTKHVNIAFYAIPMGKRWNGRFMEDYEIQHEDSSSARQEYVPPSHHIADGKWHQRSFSYNFQELSDTIFVVFAPRINEGIADKGIAHVIFSRVRFQQHFGP